MVTEPRAAEPVAPLMPMLWRRLRPYRRPIALLLVLQLAQAIGGLYLPTLNADIVDHGILPGDIGYIVRQGAVMLGATLVQITCATAAVYFGAQVAMGLGRDLRAAVFGRVQDFSAREVNLFGAPSLITRTTNDVQEIQVLVFIGLTLMVTAPFMALGGIVLAASQDLPLSTVLVVAIPVLIAAIGLVISRMVVVSRVMQVRIDAVNQVMREHIAGVRVIRAFVRERHEDDRFSAVNASLTEAALKTGRMQAFFGATVGLVSNVAAVAVVAFGGMRLVEGSVQLGSLIAFLNYLGQILMAVMMAMTVFMLAPRAKVSAARIGEVLDTEPGVAEPVSPVRPSGTGVLEARDVGFRYPGAEEPVLVGANLRAEPGQVTAVIGATGSGKTTLISLLARLVDADDGAVTIDGVDVRDVDRSTLAGLVGLVPQRAYLFSGTIASNLRYGDPSASDEQLWRALEVAQAADFVRAMPDGLETRIGQGGTTVSGGQRQRLAIARVLVAKPRIYLFDDAFSALDSATDAALRAALETEIEDAAQVVVAQRVSTIRSADRIVVLEAGRVEAVGTHEELLATSPTYAEIVNSQLTPQEAL